MELKLILLLSVLCAVIINIECAKPCDNLKNVPESTRVKRAKYYSNPQRFARRPSTYPTKGEHSFTRPIVVNEDDSYVRGYQYSKLNKKPIAETLGDEDINNFVKYLSKQDLDKIVEVAKYKGKYNRNESYESKLSAYKDDNVHKQIKEVNIDQQLEMNTPHIVNTAQNDYDTEFSSPITMRDTSPRIVNTNAQMNHVDFSNTHLDSEESMKNSQVSFFNYHMEEDGNIKHTSSSNDADLKDIEPEELLPRPVNLRDDHDFDGSFTNNVPSVLRADPSYKVESFRDLPLMNYNRHKNKISSYQAPHYTVTTFPKTSSSSSSPTNTPLLEPAPPISEAKHQSDAHLKATRIWTHKSKGTAYYLHPDGTLSLEIPKRIKPYSHPYK